ncbi:MAG: hypothetical protein PVG81_12300 [Desulfobacterales bacterium]|jgi:hypothetical protein
MGDDRTRFKDVQDAQVFGPKSRNDNLNFQGNMTTTKKRWSGMKTARRSYLVVLLVALTLSG